MSENVVFSIEHIKKNKIVPKISDDELGRYIKQKKKDDLLLLSAARDVFMKTRKGGSKNKTPAKLTRKLNRHSHVNRNQLCPCGSGKKFKYCCMRVKNG